jgi:peptide/nickel transport system permease protein
MKQSLDSAAKRTGIREGSAEQLAPHESQASMVWRRFRRHPGAVAGSIVLSILVLSTLLVTFSPYDPETSDMDVRLQPPSWKHPFGTDQLGRDMLTRVLYGGRISLSVGLMVVVITLVIGVPIGAVAGYFGGWVDNILMRTPVAAGPDLAERHLA